MKTLVSQYRRGYVEVVGGCEVVLAVDGSEAVEVLRERKAEIGLVLLDLTMPRMDGWETLEALRELHA